MRPGDRTPQYQTFADAKGGSKSDEKLAALKLQRLDGLSGKSVLDLGCNEGFFCEAALDRGARRVLGIDRSPVFIERARARFPAVEFRKGTWWDIPNETFDVILFLSAVHYEVEQKRLFDKLLNHLAPGGTLVLECGIAPNNIETGWIEIYRGTDPTPRRYPTRDYLVKHLMPAYVVQAIGPSVTQKGDPLSRWVFHCKKRKSMVLIATGPSGDGKSLLAETFRQHGIPVYRTDALFRRLLKNRLYLKTPLAQTLLASEPVKGKKSAIVGPSTALITSSDNLMEQFVEIVCREAPLDAPISIIEGEIFRHAKARRVLTRHLEEKDIIVWQAVRAGSDL